MIPVSSYSQRKKTYSLNLKGSYFIVAIGCDGIMMAADSRGSFNNKNDPDGTTLAYYDSVQKIFPVNNFAMTETGNALYGKLFLSSIMKLYVQSTSKNISIYNSIEAIADNFKKNMPLELFNLFIRNQLVIAGYSEKGIPVVSFFDGPTSHAISHFENVGTIEPSTTDFKAAYSNSMTCQQLGEIAEMAMIKHAKDKPTIGGPIRIVKITPSGVVWLKNRPEFDWETSDSFFADLKAGKVEINYTSDENKKSFYKMIEQDTEK